MHCVLDRHATRFPATVPTLAPTRQLSQSISEIMHASENQMALLFRKTSMPCLPIRVSQARPFKRVVSRAEVSTTLSERPGSASSTGSSRRSVSSMKQLLPLQLQPAPPLPKTDLSAWLENTAPNLPSPAISHSDSEQALDPMVVDGVPWMRSSQDVRLSHDLAPNKYRETPVYSEPGSPLLSRAYFSDSQPCCGCPAPALFCEELCIVNDYEETDTADSYSQNSIVDCPEDFAAPCNLSVDTSRSSFTSSPISRLSIQCQGESSLCRQASWIEKKPRPWDCETTGRASSDSADSGIVLEKTNLDAWIESDVSQSSSVADEEVFSAYITKLAPAKAQVIELSRSTIFSSRPVSRSSSSWQPRPSTPYKQRRMTALDSPYTTPRKDADENMPPERETLARQISATSVSQNFRLRQSSPPPIPPPKNSPEFEATVIRNSAGRQNRDHGHSENDEAVSIIDAIHDAVQSFQPDKLLLESPCVAAIRRLNLISASAMATQGLSIPPLSEPDLPLSPRKSWRHSLRRPVKTGGLFSPLKRSAITRRSSRRGSAPPSTICQSSSKRSRNLRSYTPDPPSPDMLPLRKIFPLAEKPWLEALYSHLLAYNYLCDARATSGLRIVTRPLKASLTLGIPHPFRHPVLSAGPDPYRDELKVKLASLIGQIVTGAPRDRKKTASSISESNRPDLENDALLRALAEIARICEKI